MKTMLIMFLACVISQSFILYTGGNSWAKTGGSVTNEGYSFTSLPASFDTYFYTASETSFALSMFIRTSRNVTCEVEFNGQNIATKSIASSKSAREVLIGTQVSYNVNYNKITITITGTTAATSGLVEKFNINGVFTNERYVSDFSSFNWGRMGGSGRFDLEISRSSAVYYFYSEVYVNFVSIGTYLIANGFEQGQFGMQVNSATQRRVVFSVSSGYQGKNAQSIAAQHTVELIKLGPGVTRANCVSQGSGGQSFLRFNWMDQIRYKFLVKAQPLSQNATTFTAWFGDPTNTTTGGWRLIASWKRPMIRTYLTGIYHSIETFLPDYGNIGKKASYINQRYYDQTETWKAVTQLTFNADTINNQRVDTEGSSGHNNQLSGDASFLRINAFIPNFTPNGGKVQNALLDTSPFSIDFAALPY